jgi:hypothetical protein
MNPKLEIRRANNEPKCANCGWFAKIPEDVVSRARCARHDIQTLDLAVCSEWRDGDPVQEILPPESNK